MHNEELFAVSKDAHLALQIMEQTNWSPEGSSPSACTSREDDLCSWRGSDQREERLSKLFNADAFLALLEFTLANDQRLDALFWDVDGLVCRGVDKTQG